MPLFAHGHATHPDWTMAAALVLAQLRAQMALPGYAPAPSLALLYITDHYAGAAQDILDHLSAELPGVTDWSGTVGVGVSANNVEYFDEPAMVVMLCDSAERPVPGVFRCRAAEPGFRRLLCAGACRSRHAGPGRTGAGNGGTHRRRAICSAACRPVAHARCSSPPVATAICVARAARVVFSAAASAAWRSARGFIWCRA